MEARRIGWLVGDLRRFLRLFDDCFARREGREHLQRYVNGQLSNVRRKCVEPMADALGMPPRTLQDFLATHTWDHPRRRRTESKCAASNASATSPGYPCVDSSTRPETIRTASPVDTCG